MHATSGLQVGRSEGIQGFYRGFGAVLAGVVPATALYFGGYESGKRLLPADAGIVGDMFVGCYAQALAGVAFTPVDIIKERMQVRLPAAPGCQPMCTSTISNTVTPLHDPSAFSQGSLSTHAALAS